MSFWNQTPAAGGGTDYSADFATLNAKLDAVDAKADLAAPRQHEIRQFNTQTGVAPAGWTKVGGIVAPASYGAGRVMCANAFNAGNSYVRGAWVYGNSLFSWTQPLGTFTKYTVTADADSALAGVNPYGAGYYPTTCAADPARGRIYAWDFNSTSSSTEYHSYLKIYDVATDSWSAGASVPYSAWQRITCVLPNGMVLLAGGYTYNHYTQSFSAAYCVDYVQWYDPDTNTYIEKNPLPVRMAAGTGGGYGTLVLADGRVLVHPAKTSDGAAYTSGDRWWLYAPDTDTWSELDAPDSDVTGYGVYALYENADGTITVVPQGVTPGTPKGRILDVSASYGSQWSAVAFTEPNIGLYSNYLSGELRPFSNGLYPIFVKDAYTLALLNTDGPVASAGPFYAIKN